jgi:hypothetical protein
MTAVEWLMANLISEPISEADFENNINCWNEAEEMEKQQQDEFAIGFAEWLYKWDNTRLPNGNWIIKLGLKPYTSEEVLEIYKKEKGL